MASHLAEITIRRAIATKSDAYYSDTQALGEIASLAFEKNKSQMRNLESIANSAVRVSDILDYVKRQTGRSRPSKQWRWQDLGHNLLKMLDETTREHAQTIVDSVRVGVKEHRLEDDDLRRVHILLCRELIRHLSIHYLYRATLGGVSLAKVLDYAQRSESDPQGIRQR